MWHKIKNYFRTMNTFQAVILAGGKGTRLKTISKNTPKPMTKILGKPLLHHQIELCAKQGITDIHLLVGYKSEVIFNYFLDGSSFGVKIYYHKEDKPRGTAGALLDVLDLLNDQFIIIYGDTFLNVDLISFLSFHNKKNAKITIFLHPNNHPSDSDLIEIDEQKMITDIYRYPHPPNKSRRNLVNAGLYIFNKSALVNTKISQQKIDIAKNLFPKLLEDKSTIFGYISTEYIKDMGTPERLLSVEKDILSGRVDALSKSNHKRAIFIDRDGVINKEVGHLNSLSQFELISGVAESIRKINNKGILVIIITNQPVIARGELSEKELRIIHNKMDTLLGLSGAYVDAIYYCPHHPHKGFKGEIAELKKECLCRKPSPGMILKAADELNVALDKSWMIGDSTSDILAAKNANVKSILVKTGHSGKDGKYNTKPDYIANNLKEAINWITSS
jgi:D,D-heptose 1,7-bisphosphate phosphatase